MSENTVLNEADSATKESGRNIIKGGEFLVKETNPNEVFIPEDFTEDDKMFAQSTQDFIDRNVIPVLDEVDEQKEGVMLGLLNEAADLGLLGFQAPEKYGGLEQAVTSAMLVTQVIGGGHSFAVSYAAHIGIGMMPIVLYGNEEQKEKYLPGMISGELKGAYCLTEPGSGSDANSLKTKAAPSEDGSYYLVNGQKMWITNGGFADVFIVFTRIEGDKGITAFIIERDFEGVNFGAEEKKMGIKGSSTCQLFFENCKVPKENLLGPREGGFKIAMNILNLGRLKLAGATAGAARRTIQNSVEYAVQREQFGQAIANFGAIQHKLGEQAIKSFATESALYRACKQIEDYIQICKEKGMDYPEAALEAYKEYAVEASLLKVYASEALDYIVDEGVQIFGGMGYSAEAPVERAYRDSRINRIFEGTNEINRLLVVDMLIKRAMKGEIDLMGPAQKVAAELVALPELRDKEEGLLAEEMEYIRNFKKVGLMIAGSAVQKLMMNLSKEQELLINISDIIAEAYVAESVVLRVQKMAANLSEGELKIYEDVAKTYVYDAADKINKFAKDAVNAFQEGDELRMLLLGIKRFTKTVPVNTKTVRREIVKLMIDKNGMPF